MEFENFHNLIFVSILLSKKSTFVLYSLAKFHDEIFTTFKVMLKIIKFATSWWPILGPFGPGVSSFLSLSLLVRPK